MGFIKAILDSKYGRIIRYLISGGSAVVTDLAVLFILEHFFHIWYLVSAFIAFIIAVCVSFTMQKFFTFNDQSRATIHTQMGLYLTLQICNLVINTWLMYLAVDLGHIHYILAQILISIVMAIYNFFIYRHWVFRPDTSIHD